MKQKTNILKALEELPLHRFLGLKIEEMKNGTSRLSIPINNHTLNPAGNIHGGVIYLVADVAAFTALLSVLDEDRLPVTIDIQTSIYNGTTKGPVSFYAHVTKKGKRLAFMNVQTLDADGNLVAETRVTKSLIHLRNITC